MRYLQRIVAWGKRHPTSVINLAFILIVLGVFTYLMVKPIDVLQDWTLTTSKQAVGSTHPCSNLSTKGTEFTWHIVPVGVQ